MGNHNFAPVVLDPQPLPARDRSQLPRTKTQRQALCTPYLLIPRDLCKFRGISCFGQITGHHFISVVRHENEFGIKRSAAAEMETRVARIEAPCSRRIGDRSITFLSNIHHEVLILTGSYMKKILPGITQKIKQISYIDTSFPKTLKECLECSRSP
ncbi:hypothetical protein XENTR_v10015013 [Xenopus tropicalis]|nr:hypothetical protein XENTR_v10015013 [Xenopus tropicalis]